MKLRATGFYSLKHFSLHLVIYLFIHESFILSANSVNVYVRNRRINNKCTNDCITEFMPSIHATCYLLKYWKRQQLKLLELLEVCLTYPPPLPGCPVIFTINYISIHNLVPYILFKFFCTLNCLNWNVNKRTGLY